MNQGIGRGRAFKEARSGALPAQMRATVMEIVGQHFRPEPINRVDEIVVFHPLAQGILRGEFAARAVVRVGAREGRIVLGRA